MKHLRLLQTPWILLLAALVLGVSFITPALATPHAARHESAQTPASTGLATNVYIMLDTLQSMFQASINQQVPQDVSSAITTMISKLPKQDQGWAAEMATTLIQPSASLQSITLQKDGLATTLTLALYQGDPKPIHISMLVSFSVLDSSTIQVSVTPMNGGPALANGPMATFQISLGSLNAVNTTPGCGNAALALHLQVPVSLGQSASARVQGEQGTAVMANAQGHRNPMAVMQSAKPRDNGVVKTLVEIPASSLASLSGTIGSMPVGGSFTAQNVRITVRSGAIHILSDIYWSGLNIGTADTTVQPTASGGNLVAHVTNTNMNIFGLFSVPMNSYNQQIEQTLNGRLGNAFTGKFSVDSAKVGPTSDLPCAASDSLVLTGSSNIG